MTPEVEPEPTLRDYLEVLRRRRTAIGAVFAVTLAAALLAAFVLPPTYRATATIVADKPGGSITLFPDVPGLGSQSYVDTLAEIVKSASVAEGAARRLGATGPDLADQVEAIQRGLSVQRIRGTDMIRIDATHRDPAEAARRADAVARSAISLGLEARRTQASATRQFIEEQLRVVTGDLRAAEDALLEFKAKGGSVSLSEETTLKVTRLADFEAQLVAAQTERRTMEAQLDRSKAQLERLAKIAPATWTASPLVGPLRQQLAQLEVELAGLREQFTNQHPAVIATQAKIAEVKAKLNQEIAKSLDAQTYAVDPVYQDLARQTAQAEVTRYALLAKEAALTQAIARWSGDIKNLPPKELALARLTRNQKVAEDVYVLLSQKYQEARIAEASVVPDIRVVDRAKVPRRPIKPSKSQNAILGAVLGLLLGVAAALALEQLDRTFRTPDEVERTVGLPVLGVVPHAGGRRNGRGGNGRGPTPPIPLVTDMKPKAVFAESLRSLCTGLLYSGPEGSLKAILVTSAGPGEGKTTIAANVAVSLAQLGMKVALVDCDLRRPQLVDVFQPGAPFGLSDYLVGQVAEADAVQATRAEGLSLVPSGHSVPNPARLFNSQKMGEFLTRLRQTHDVVVLDSAPVLPVTDATILSRSVDGVLLVAHSGTSDREAVLRTRRRLESVGANVIGVVFNDISLDGRGSYYYPYYYAYSEGEQADEKAPAEVKS